MTTYVSRRDMLRRSGMGMGSVALTALLGESGSLEAATSDAAMNPLAPRKPHFPGQGKAGHSSVYERRAVPCRHLRSETIAHASLRGKPLPITLKTERQTGAAFPSPFGFKKYGQSGIEVSDIFPQCGRMHG